MQKKFTLIFIILSAVTNMVWAARPFVTDDARLTTAGSCQLESWTRIYRTSTEIWALPACNPTGNLELTLGQGRAFYAASGVESADDYIFQAKTLFRKLETNSYGFGLAAGTVRHPAVSPGPNLFGNSYIYLPYSASFADDELVMHLNVGWLKERSTEKNLATWGVGTEWNVNERVTWLVEAFGETNPHTYWQAGGRFSLIPQLLQVDTTLGSAASGNRDNRWISFGLRFTPSKLF
jgi:hypothetical protein